MIDEKKIPMGTKECNEHRKTLNLPDVGKTDPNMPCKDRFCYDACPVISKKEPKKKQDNPSGINLEVFKEIQPDNPKKAKKISKEIEDFLWMQQRVIAKLAWRPEIWKALDKFSADDILDKLLGKTGLEEVPTLMGGKMPFQASKQTKKMFADLENKFADEDEKSGKSSIHDLGESEQLTLGDGEFSLQWREEPHGYFDKGVYKEPEKKEVKKNGKKNKNVIEKT